MCVRSPSACSTCLLRPSLDELDEPEQRHEVVISIVVRTGPCLAGDDIAHKRFVAVFDHGRESRDRERVAPKVIDDEGRIEQIPHGQASGPASVTSARRARTQSTTISEVANSG